MESRFMGIGVVIFIFSIVFFGGFAGILLGIFFVLLGISFRDPIKKPKKSFFNSAPLLIFIFIVAGIYFLVWFSTFYTAHELDIGCIGTQGSYIFKMQDSPEHVCSAYCARDEKISARYYCEDSKLVCKCRKVFNLLK